jgi:dihydroorotate dehydrogenase (fumarate)
MPRLDTDYMNLKLCNPILVGSSGLTKNADKIKACEDAGAGAVVVKSLFEEVLAQADWGIGSTTEYHAEAYDYLRAQLELSYGPREYCQIVEEAKSRVDIPVIASINCVSTKWWPSYAKQIEEAGADALELNVFTTAFDSGTTGDALEALYYEIIQVVKSKIRIPVAIKLGSYFTSLPNVAAGMCRRGADALVLFNRFTVPDIDIDKLELKTTFSFSTPTELHLPLRWIAILAGKIECDLAATTGIHDASGIIKMLLAGATVVQLSSVLYRQGVSAISGMITDVERWMSEHGYESIDQYRGLLSFEKTDTKSDYLRAQFMEKIRGYE